ncbi:MAG: ACP S-malonyltransferase [Patescibacteria group bacterium]|nr:ACP S-malonyltransferase [Patescibacteria group bacterium]
MTVTTAKKIAFLYPGQGSQEVGMAHDLFHESPAAQEVLREAGQIWENDQLLKIMFEGPEEKLKRTEITQPAILAASIAVLAAIKERLGENAFLPDFTTGQSLGLFTALVAADVLNLEDGMRLVIARGSLMQKACEERPGGMVALIGIDEIAVNEICREAGVSLANINGEKQMVIAGNHKGIVMAIDLATARGAKRCIPLEVEGAFHSGLMKPAESGLIKIMESLAWHDPIVPIIANCSTNSLTSVEEIWKEVIIQLTSCVNWKTTILKMRDEGVETFWEIGPGQVLKGLMRRIDRDAEVINVSGMDSVRALTA